MRTTAPVPTTPHRDGHRRIAGLARTLRDRRGQHDRDVVIRVPLGQYGRTYAYVCRGPVSRGALVEVDAMLAGRVVVPVVGFGRGLYFGPLKRARPVRT